MSMRRDPAASAREGRKARTHSDRSAHMPALDEREKDEEMTLMIYAREGGGMPWDVRVNGEDA